MDLKEVHRAVSKIKTSVFKKSNHYAIGALKSHFRGSGLQFKEHRVYDHGDDVRFIDWKLLAKTNNPYVKTFEEERNVEIMIILDASPTMFYGHNNTSKLQASIELCCLLYLLAKETQDVVHVLIKAKEITYIPKKTGDEGITSLINLLQRLNILHDNGTINLDYYDEEDGLILENETQLLRHLGKKKEIVIFSDFLNFLPEDALKRLLYKRKIHAFSILSPIDLTTKLPYSVFARFPGTKNSRLVDTNIELPRLKELFRNRVKPLRVDENYLDGFVKEMV